MKKKILAFALSTVLLLSSCCGNAEVQASAVSAQSASSAQNLAAQSTGGIRPEQFGAKGDGIADDLQPLQAAIKKASETGAPLELTPGAVYRFTAYLLLPSGLTVRGNGAVLLSDIQYVELGQDRVAVDILGDSPENKAHDIRLENVVFRAAESCQSNVMLRMMRARNVAVVDCVFDCQKNEWSRGAADLYGSNEDITFENCTFHQMTAGKEGGIWVRNWTDKEESRGIRFQNCDFYKAGADEVLAVWGWGGTVRDVVISNCCFYETETQESLEAGNCPDWFITLGQSGKTDVRMENCTISAEYCGCILHMAGDETHAVVDNCDITLKQPKDTPKHDMSKGANPMLAFGNGRADGSTVIQNSRITLNGDSGRRVCYKLSALRDNTMNLSLGYGIAGTQEVTGNTIQGTIRHKVFQDCGNVQNNDVKVKRFSWLW